MREESWLRGVRRSLSRVGPSSFGHFAAEVIGARPMQMRRRRPPADQETATDAVDGPIDPVLRVGDQGPTNRGGR
jgi:hypothetical protein